MPKKKSLNNGKDFGKRLAQLRKEAGFTQREFAKELQISQRMVAYYEAQTEHPPTQLLHVLTQVLGVSADELLGLAPIKQQRPANQRLWRRFRQIEKLPTRERKQLLAVIDTFLERERLSQKQT